MLIRRIELKNFRNVAEETLDTPLNEAFILLGKNGSSKSTFLWAVPFCFYGFSDWTLKNTLKWGKDQGYVKVYFSIKDNRYVAERSFDRTSSSFRLYQLIDGELEELGGGLNKEAEEQFKKIFPVPKEVFLQVVTRVQTDNLDYQLGSFCGATPAKMFDHIKHFVEVVKIEKYEKVNSQIIKDLQDDKIRLESKIESAKSSIEDLELEDASEEDIQKKEKAVNDLNKKMNELQSEKSDAEKYYDTLEKYEDAQEVIKKFKGIKDWYDRWQELKAIKEPEIKYSEEKVKEIKEGIKAKEKSIDQLEESLEEENDKLDNLIEREETLEEELMELIDKQNDYENKKKSIEEEIKLLKEGKCPKCERKFRSTEKRIPKKEKELEELDGPFDVDAKRKERRSAKSDIESKRTRIRNIKDNIQANKQGISKDETKLEKAKSSKEQTEKWNERKQFVEDYPFETNPDKAYMEYQNAIEKEKPEGEKPRKPEKLQKLYQETLKEYTDLSSELKEIKNNKERYQHFKEVIKENEDEFEAVKEKLDKHMKLSKIYGRTGAPHFMIKEFLHFLQHYSNQYLDKFTNGRISIKFKTNHNSSKPIELIFYDADRNNKPRPYSTFSRGEKTRVALSIEFLGMGRVFGSLTNIDLKTGLIDEVYGLDEEGQKEFAEILTELSGIRPVMGGVVCFESMSHNFENVIRVEDGRLINN